MNSKQIFKLTVDALILAISTSGIRVLLIRRKYDPFQDHWAIPGGFVEYNEDLHDAAIRELREETGLSLTYLKQYHTFGHPDRDPRGRAVSVAFFGLIHGDQHAAKADSDAAEVNWFSIKELPELAFDHEEILRVGLNRILNHLRADRKELEKFHLSDPDFDLIEDHLTRSLLI